MMNIANLLKILTHEESTLVYIVVLALYARMIHVQGRKIETVEHIIILEITTATSSKISASLIHESDAHVHAPYNNYIMLITIYNYGDKLP